MVYSGHRVVYNIQRKDEDIGYHHVRTCDINVDLYQGIDSRGEEFLP